MEMEKQDEAVPQGEVAPLPVLVPPPVTVFPNQVVFGQPGQPQKVQWMSRPSTIPGCPPGLEYLTQIDQVVVQQQMELLEIFTDIDFANKYVVSNSLGQQIYYAMEHSNVCMRVWCESERGFEMRLQDNEGKEVIRVIRDFKCCYGCCCCIGVCGASDNCCAYLIKVEAPPGQTVGYVRQSFSKWTPKYTIFNAEFEPLLHIKGPCCPCQCVCGCIDDLDFKILSLDKQTEVGKVTKQWGGVMKEWITKADTFSMNFPLDLDVKVKATLFGALFLIDFMFFEESKNNNG